MPELSLSSLLVCFGRLPARSLLGAIWLYQHTVSPACTLWLGPGWGCRFQPTCSHYAAEAVRLHGAGAGSWLAATRLLRCTPFCAGGHDPVPPRLTLGMHEALPPHPARPACRRVEPATTRLDLSAPR